MWEMLKIKLQCFRLPSKRTIFVREQFWLLESKVLNRRRSTLHWLIPKHNFDKDVTFVSSDKNRILEWCTIACKLSNQCNMWSYPQGPYWRSILCKRPFSSMWKREFPFLYCHSPPSGENPLHKDSKSTLDFALSIFAQILGSSP